MLVPIIVVVVLLVLSIAFWARYKTVGADNAMVVTGSFLGRKNVMDDQSGRKMKIVRGGGTFVLPIFQKAEQISLLSHKLTVSTPEVYTELGVPVMADGVAIIKVGGTLEDISTAAEQFMGKSDEVLQDEAEEVLEGHLRAILGTMTVEEIYKNRDKFAQEVQAVAAKDLKKMGLQIVSFTIKDVRDNNGYLDSLGKPRIAAVRRDAEIAEAEAKRDTDIKRAAAMEEGRKAQIISETNIAEAEKEKEIKTAQFRAEQDMKKAEADTAYQLQENRSKQQVVEEEMKINLVRKQKEIELEEKEILRREKQYDAEVRKKADADRYAKEQSAEANRYEREAQARAEAEAIKAKGQADAEAEKARGIAAAEIIRQKGLAEAEAKQKLAEAFEQYGQAAVLDLIVKMLPELAEQISRPIASIDKISVVDTGHGTGAAKVSNYVTDLMSTAPEMLKNISGIDLNHMIQEIVNGESKKSDVSRDLNINRLPHSETNRLDEQSGSDSNSQE
ncbi:MAG: flotillin family protein [Bacillaceae bacterium]|nr:flotillin family protein [Bacillaceae bacterium]